jgi:hypothetical protein
MNDKELLADISLEMIEIITKQTRGDIELKPHEVARLEKLAYTINNYAQYGCSLTRLYDNDTN